MVKYFKLLLIIVLILPTNGCREICTICFYLDQNSCKISEVDLNNSQLKIDIWEWEKDGFGSFLVPVGNVTTP